VTGASRFLIDPVREVAVTLPVGFLFGVGLPDRRT
jgi:hypothetical protein